MTPFTVLSGPAALLEQANIDTDQIIPARFLRRPRSDGYNNFLFHDLRATDADFPLTATDNAEILVAGENFGCGSSREGAVYALADAGVRCVIAPGFGDIFGSNASRNGLLTVVLAPEAWSAVRDAVASGAEITIDLRRQHVRAANTEHRFEIDPFRKQRLLRGVDDIALTLESADDIDNFEANIPSMRAWSIPG